MDNEDLIEVQRQYKLSNEQRKALTAKLDEHYLDCLSFWTERGKPSGAIAGETILASENRYFAIDYVLELPESTMYFELTEISEAQYSKQATQYAKDYLIDIGTNLN